MLLRFIRDEWGSEEAFDKFVRTDLLAVLVSSQAAYQGQLGTVAAESFALVFGD